jgi:hypothetical protein
MTMLQKSALPVGSPPASGFFATASLPERCLPARGHDNWSGPRVRILHGRNLSRELQLSETQIPLCEVAKDIKQFGSVFAKPNHYSRLGGNIGRNLFRAL